MVFSDTVNTPIQGFRSIFNRIMNVHDNIVTEDGAFTYEGETCVIHIRDPMADHEDLINASCQGPQSFNFYREQLVEGKHTEGFSYTYYGRMTDYPVGYDADGDMIHVNQTDNIIHRLASSPLTRRAVAVLWHPEIDRLIEDPPCMDLQKYNIRNGKLNLRVVFRSHDALKAWPQNIYGISHLMDSVADNLGVPVGYLEVTSFDPHIYYKSDQNLVKSTMHYFDERDRILKRMKL